MAKLIECASCGGLKRIDSRRCPHCHSATSSVLKSSLAAAGLGAMAACGASQPPCTPEPLGFCAPIVNNADSGPPMGPPMDAYGIVALPDSGFTGVDAYGIAPIHDAGTPDAGQGDGGPQDAGDDSGADD